MVKRLWILAQLQLSNKRKIQIESKKRKLVKVAIGILSSLVLTVVLFFILKLVKDVFRIPVNTYFLVFLIVITQGINITTSALGLVKDLYESRENQLLLSYPVKNAEVFISKLIVYYLTELFKSAFFSVPLLLAYGLLLKAAVPYFLSVAVLSVVMPLLTVLIAALLSIPLALLKMLFKRYNFLGIIATLVCFALIFYGLSLLMSKIPPNIRIIQLYNRFLLHLTRFIQDVAQVGSIYLSIGFLLAGIKTGLHYLILLAVIIGGSLLVYFVSIPLYFRMTSHSLELATEKKHRSQRPKKPRRLFTTFLVKELKLSWREVGATFNDYALMILLPIVLYIMNSIYMAMNRSTLGNVLVLTFNIFTMLALTLASNTASASAITREGTEFVLLKTAPGDVKAMAWAKILFNLAFSSLIIFFSFIIFRVSLPAFPVHWVWLLFGLVVLINAGHILWSFQIDLVNPQLAMYAATESLTGNPNITKSLTIGFVLALLFALATLFIASFSIIAVWILLYGFAGGFLCYRFYFFGENLKAYFYAIEL